jgi:protein-tyrosine kinase
MERIKKALEKAQQERQNADKTESVRVQATTSVPVTETQQIAYSETRTIDVPPAMLKEHRIIAGFDDDPRADLFKILRTKILQRMHANNWNVLAVSSPTSGNGKSNIAINLAISIAMDANYSVLLADLDLRNANMHKQFGMPAEPGLSDYFADKKTIPELLVHPGLEKLVFLPAGHPIKRSSDLLTSPKMLELATELKNRYADRIIVVDLPPLLQTDDAMVFMPNVDACILVVAEGENSAEDVQKSIELIEPDKYLGSVLNKSAEYDLAKDLYG